MANAIANLLYMLCSIASIASITSMTSMTSIRLLTIEDVHFFYGPSHTI